MATYNDQTNTFVLEAGEVNFTIPDTIPSGESTEHSNVQGNALNNVLTGSDGSNELSGGDGNDTLIGGLGEDHLIGGAGFDIVSYEYSTSGLRIDLNVNAPPAGPALAAGTDSDSYVSIEGVIGSNHNDTIVGSNAVSEWLNGGAGIDDIQGGDGNDTIIGGVGADILRGGAGIDTLSYATAGSGVNVTLNSANEAVNGFGSLGDANGDNINGFENLTGSNHADTLNGNDGANFIDGGVGNDILVGKGGNDTLFGGLGADDMQGLADNDLYYVDDAMDYVRERGGEGYDHVITTVTFDLAARGNGEIELFQAAAGAGAINLYGNYHTNRIIGNEANNIIDGRGGADTMEGGGGDDTYYVDNAGDVVIDSQGNNIVYTSANFNGTQFSGKVIATGSAGISMTGDASANTILGNAGANRINGGIGNDVLTGGSGRDSFVFDSKIGDHRTNKTFNLDRITDFKVKQDKILLDNAIFKKLKKTGKLKDDFFKLGSKATDKNDYLVYNKSKKTLSYDVDGSGSKKAVEIIKFDKKINLTAADILVI